MDLSSIQITRKKVKHARIVISPDCTISLTVPNNFSQKNIEFVLRSREDWIRRTLARLEKNKKFYFHLEPDQMLYLGEIFSFEKIPLLENSVKIFEEERKIISGVNLLNAKIQEEFLKIQAKRKILPRAEELAQKNNFSVKKIFIRGQKTKWGTCSTLGNISLNWRLMKAPWPVIDYVILHELAHLKEMNHSRKYWAELEKICPDYKIHRDWLKKYGRNL